MILSSTKAYRVKVTNLKGFEDGVNFVNIPKGTLLKIVDGTQSDVSGYTRFLAATGRSIEILTGMLQFALEEVEPTH